MSDELPYTSEIQGKLSGDSAMAIMGALTAQDGSVSLLDCAEVRPQERATKTPMNTDRMAEFVGGSESRGRSLEASTRWC